MKFCTKCKIEKEESEFHKNKNTKDGLNFWCKLCVKDYNMNNIDKIKDRKKNHYNDNKERILECKKNYDIKNKDKNLEYRSNNKNKIKDTQKNYRDNNKEQILEYNKNYIKQRRLKDPIYKLRINISSIIHKALKKQDSSKAGESILKYLPYTINEFKQHLESQWESWMNWNNYGRTNNNKRTWQIDHIIPQSLLPFTSMEEENFRKCWALENLRPIEAFANIKKGNKI
jgi:hypothetical protein